MKKNNINNNNKNMERNKNKKRTKKGTIRKNTLRTNTNKTNYITNYQSAEGIIKIILDKIINLSIRQSGVNKINNQLNNYCFKFIQNQVSPLFEENYINYTYSNINSNKIFWKNKKPEVNNWIEIKEPDAPQNDRFEGVFINYKELESKNKKISLNEINEGLENDNLIKKEIENIQKEEINKTPSKNKSKKKIVVVDNNEIKNKEEISINKSKIQNQPSIQTTKGNKRVQMVALPFSDIPNIDKEFIHDEYDPPNINKLRKEREEQIKRKEKEKRLKIEEKKMEKKKIDSEKLNKKFKQLDSNKFTFDSNGQIISFKQYKLENLSKDFNFIKNSIKENDMIKPIKKRKISIKETNIKIVEEIIKNPIEEEKKEKSEKISEKNKEKILPSGSNFQIILPNIGVTVKENQKIKEGGREFNKFFNKYSIHDYDKILNEYVPLQNKTKMRNAVELLNLTASSPIHKKISESVDNPRHISQNNNFVDNNKTFNFNNYNSNDNLNNPLLTTNDNIQINVNDTENNNINNLSNYLKTSVGINSFNKNSNNYNPLMTSFNLRTGFMNNSQGKRGVSFNDSIMMKKAGATSLKLEIESMADLKNDKTYYGPQNLKQNNIFGKNFMKNYKIGLFKPPVNNSLAVFNKNILTDSNWGNKTGEKGPEKNNIVFARHHTKIQALRELGSNILSGIKIKLPKNRKVELVNK